MNHLRTATFLSVSHAVNAHAFAGIRNPLFRIALGALLLLGFSQPARAQVPDLTAGDLPPNAGVWFNLGPTGVQAWVYRGIEGNPTIDTSLSRQIQVNSVEAGSPAAGILQVGDVILGANGTGGAPSPFTADARKSFALAIADAEARNPATLALLVWRAGTTSTMTLTLRTMGAYSATAPFNCPKSAKILDEGLDYAMANQDAGYAGISALALLAADNPADPKNAARQARAQTYALAQMLSPAQIKYIKDGNVELGAKIAWERGLRLVTLTEYYLKTEDAQVLPSIDAIALSIAQGQGANGAVGHLFNTSIKKGTYNEPFGRGYTMNASTLPSALGLVLARKCGVTLPELDPAIERVTRTLAGNAGLGTFNYYVEGEPGLYNEDNGKSALGAIVFAMHNDRVKEAKFMSSLAIGGAEQREDGHITHYFGLLWGPLGCQVGGQAAAVAHFNEIRWQLDLNRWWDGGFEYERFDSTGMVKTPSMNSGARFWMSTAALLTYAMPLQQLEITGKTFATRPELTVDSSEIAAAVLSNNYVPTSRTTAELMQDLQSQVTGLTVKAAKELAARPTEATAQVETLIARAADPLGTARTGACRALGEIRDDRAVLTLLGLLSDPNEDLRYLSAEALAKFPTALLKENLNTLLQIAAANAKPAYPLDFDDAQQLAQMKLGEVIFGVYGTSGALGGDLTGIDRDILYPAIRAFSAHPHGVARNRVAAIYNKLTPADVTALSDALIEVVNYFGLASMTQTPGLEGIKLLERDNWAEGIPLTKDYIINSRFKNIATCLTELQDYGTAALTVTPNPQVIDFLNSMLGGEYQSRTANTDNAQIIAIRDALLAASNPPVLPSFKSIQSVTASPAILTLPAKQTRLNVSFTDLSQGDTVFSWRKVHGPGNVTFSTNDTSGSISPQVYFEAVPGLYLFEVKAWDARNLTEVTGTVQMELRDSGGSLPANLPPTANAQSVTVAQAIPTPITLTGTDPEGYPFAAFEVLSGPSSGTLGGTPPFLTYSSGFNFTGADSLSFRVRDSNGQWSAPATVSITVATRVSPVGLVIYDPVNYSTGNLNGKSGTSEIGFAGTWAAYTGNYPVKVLSTSLAYGSLPTAGGSFSDVSYTSRPLSPALASSGLLNDGATLWFSVLVGSDVGGKLRWALANNSFDSTTSVIMNEGEQLGRGVGFYMSSGSAPWTATVYAATFTDPSTTNDTGDPMFLSEAIADTGILTGQGQYRLLVGKFTWGAAQDTIQLYLPTPDMILGAPVASLNTVVDQSTFDTLTSNQARHPLDEIRFGATLESVLLGTVAMPADLTPPSPNAMTFANPPSLATPTSATMQAATAFDANYGVEYYFTCTVGGALDSGWQSSPVYTATGLTPGVSYSYTVKARDLSPALNETAPSAAFSVGTPTTTLVPALVNLPQAQAEALITGAGLVVGAVTTEPSATIETGNVAGQTPSGGTSAASGSAVDLVISSTVQMATVPNLVDLTQAAANSSLAAANLTPGTILTDYSETIAAGVVMTQNPASGASLPRNAPVELVVSAGSAAGLAPLTQVLLENFESPDVNSSVVVNTTVGGALPSNGNWGATGGYNTAGRGIIDKDSDAFNALDPNHQAFAIRSSAAGIVSSFGKIGNITAGTKYTVSVDIVKDSGKAKGTTADFQLKSFDQTANTSVLRDATNEGTVILSQGATAPMSGEFKTVTFEYIAANGDPLLGKDLGLRITGGIDGTYAANMDNVRVWTSGARLADTASPWSLTMTPADDASAVAVDSNLTMTFSENVVAGTGYITLRNLTNSTQQLISVTDTKQVSFSGSTLTINPEQNLSELSNYAILMGCDAVRDLGGNPYGGILSTTTWNFTTAASTDASAPTLISIVDNRSGTPVDTGDLVTFTVTFNEDMNAQTVTTTDFGNAGSAGLTFLGVTETSPGVFTVLVIPTSTGTLQLRINAGTVLTDTSGNPLNTGSALVDNTTLTVNLGIAPPVWSSDPVTESDATEDSIYSSTLANNVSDANGDTLIFTKVSGPTWLTVATNGALSGTPTNSNVGLNTFTVSVTDGNTAPVVATVDITVLNTNDAPTFTLNPIYRPAVTRYAAYSSSITQYAQDIDGDTLAFAKTAGPAWLNVAADGTLSGTPGVGDLGTNSFTVSVYDGTAAPVTATLIIKVNAADPVLPHIYEPFADTDSALTGNTPGLGLSGTWSASASVFVVDSSLNYGATPTSGLTMTLPSSVATISTGTTLTNAGLLANGATLWFSFLLEADDASGTNDGMAMSFGSQAQSGGSGLTMSSAGNGVGITWDRGGPIKGSYWSAGTRTSTINTAGTAKSPVLVVASVTWGADDTSNEVLSIYLPGQSLALPASPAVTQTIPPLTQSAFNKISFARRGTDGQVDLIDEIRFGSSYDHVTGQATGAGDTTPPTLSGTNIVDNRSGATIVANNPVTYTVTFNEDMNAATVGINDFSNAGTASLTINSAVETSPGVFSVQATPTTAGTLRLQVPSGAILTDVAGNLLNTASAIIDDTTITVTAPNYPPVWNSNPITEANATEDAAYSSTLSDNASDANGNTLVYTKISGPAWLSVATNGALSGTPTNIDVGVDSFTVSVTDGFSAAVQATLNITVLNSNDAPVFLSDPISVGNATEDLPFSNTLSDSATDDDGNTLTYAKVSGPAWLTVAADGTLSGTPANSNVGSNVFTVSVSDGIAPAPLDTATLTVTVVNTNDLPSWISNPITGTPGTATSPYSGTLAGKASDPDAGATLTYAKVSGPIWLTVAANGTLSGTPSTTEVGENAFTVSVTDGLSTARQATLNINVTAAPASNPLIYETFAQGAGTLGGKPGGIGLTSQTWTSPTGQVTATASALSYSTLPPVGGSAYMGANPGANQNSNASINVGSSLTGANMLNNGTTLWFSFLFKPESTSPNNDETFFALGDAGMSDTGTFGAGKSAVGVRISRNSRINAAYWNNAVSADNKTSGASANTTTLIVGKIEWGASSDKISLYLPGANLALPTTAFSTITTPGNLTQSGFTTISWGGETNSNARTFIDDIRFGASYASVVYASAPTLASIGFVDNVSGGPAMAGNLITYTVSFSEDIDATTVTAADFGNAGTSAITIGTITETSPGVFTVPVTPTTAGSLQLRVIAGAVITDVGGAALDTTTAIADNTTITVNAGNIAPTWTSNPVNESNATEEAAYNSTLADNASDANSNPLTFAKVSGPTWLNVAANGALSGTPTNSNVGANIFTVSVTDSLSTAVQATLNITVINTNDAPTWTANPITGTNATEDSAYSATLVGSASDIDPGASLTFAKASGPAWLNVASNGTLSGTPANSNVGLNSFTISVTDGIASAALTTLNITVTNTNDAPAWTSNPITGASATEDSAYSASLAGSASDVDAGASLSFTKVGGPAWLTVAPNGALSGTPTNSNVGANSFTVSVSDGIATAVQATLNITVTNTNDAPTWASNPIAGTNATEDSAYSATLAGSASDVDPGASLTFSKVSGPAWLSVATNGTLSGTPANSDVGANSFTVTVSDGIATAVQATLDITVANTNDAPTWTSNPITGANATEDSAYSATLAGSASDVDSGASLTFAKVSGPAWLSVATNGTLSGTPTNSDVGTNSFTVSVNDGIATVVQATLNLTVVGINHAPTWTSNPITGTNATEDSTYSATLAGSASDVNAGASLTFAKVGGPAWLTVAANGALSGTPTNSDVGANSFTVSVSDGIATAVQATLHITVINTNDAPIWASNPITGANATRDTAYSGSLAAGAVDVDAGTTLAFAKVSGPAWLDVAANGALSGTPSSGDAGANSFTVSDGIAPAVQATLNITVNITALVWDTDAAGNWTDVANWLGDTAYASGTDATANFGDYITANRIITLNAPIAIGNIIASDITHNYTISGANILTLDRTSGIPTIDVTASGRTLTIGSQIAGLDGLQKSGLGILALTGANSYTGDTTITGSTLNLGGATTTGSLASTVINLGGGTLSYTRTGTNTQNFTTTNIKSGASTANTTVATNTLNLGDLTRDLGGTLNFGSTGSIITSETNNGSGIIGGWATFNNANWAVANGASAITGAPTYYTTATGTTTGSNYTNDKNMDVSASVAMDATINPSTVRFNVLGASTVTLAAGDNIIDSGGILVTSTVGNFASTITGGNLAGSSGGDLIVHHHNTNALGTLTISSIIKDNGTATGLTKSGAGTLSLSGNNSYTGITTINAGFVEISHANALGTTAGNTTIAAGGQLKLLRNINDNNIGINSPENITITGSGAAIFNNSGKSSTLSGNITLDNPTGNITFSTANGGSYIVFSGTITQMGTTRDLILSTPSSGGQGLTINNPIANNGGRLVINNGGTSLLKGVNATDGTGIGETVISSSGNLKLGVSHALNTTANLTIGPTVGGTDIGTFDLANFNQTVNALIGNGTAVSNSSRKVINSVAGTKILTVGNGGGTGIFNGQIIDGSATAKIQLIKTGGGNQTLNDVNSYTGGTRIDAGTLTLGHATNTLADAGAVNVNGGTLDLGANTDTVGAITLTSGSITGTGTLTGSAYDVRTGSVSARLGGLVGLTKTTAGTVTLSGDNTYAGATNVNDGTLLVNGNQSTASGDLTVAANATLGGTGTLGGTTTIAAGGKLEFNLSTAAVSHNSLELVAGKALTYSGASTLTITSSGGASPGIYTLITGGNNIGGATLPTLNLPVGWAATVSISGSNLRLDVTSTGGPGPVDHFDISSIATPQTVGTAITGITLTAKDASNATATSFTGTVTFGGTGGFTGTSANFVSGVLTNVSVTPTAAGSNLTLAVDDGAGHTGSTAIATINPAPSPYETWSVGGVAFDADTNGDGVKNGLAWLLGASSPSQNALNNLPQASRNGTNLRLSFRCLKSTKRGTAQVKLQTSSDLGVSDPWTSHETTVPDGDSTVDGVIFDTTDDGDFINVIADIPAAGAKIFGRIKATQ